jgi:glycosyltransferase involved in cell wall biosynthesis
VAAGSSGKPARLAVVSQIPPPHHGSTMMTLVFLETVRKLGIEELLVDRRFSSTVGEVGRFSLSKVGKSFGLITRLLTTQFWWRPNAYVLFITNRPASFLVDWIITELFRVLKRPVINYVHTSGYSHLAGRNAIFRFLVRRALGSADTTVCLGESLVQDVAWAVTGDIVTIPNTPYGESPQDPADRCSTPTFLFLSNLIPEKGAQVFIEAAIDVCGSHSDVQFIVAGAAPDVSTFEQLQSLVDNSRWQNRITLVGKADDETKWDLLRRSHCLVFPSTYAFEAQPLSIVEAMSTGLPVIAYDTGGIRDLVVDNVTGYLLPANDHEALRASMRKLLNDITLFSAFGKNAKTIYQKSFSRDAYEASWSAVLMRSLHRE